MLKKDVASFPLTVAERLTLPSSMPVPDLVCREIYLYVPLSCCPRFRHFSFLLVQLWAMTHQIIRPNADSKGELVHRDPRVKRSPQQSITSSLKLDADLFFDSGDDGVFEKSRLEPTQGQLGQQLRSGRRLGRVYENLGGPRTRH